MSDICPLCNGDEYLCDSDDIDPAACQMSSEIGCDMCPDSVLCPLCKGTGTVTKAKHNKYLKEQSEIKWGIDSLVENR